MLQHFKKHPDGMVYISPLYVYLDETSNAVQPDIIVVLRRNMGIVNSDGHIHGIPDMVIEILSPGSKDHDEVVKKDLYRRLEYWLVDSETKLASGFVLDNGKHKQADRKDNRFLSSPLLELSIEF